ncbi:hypothetical protein [Burkholderia diffusa]|uniref:hypothetical protein n=1 Tax=Burkholderia diffusa TaxID=488732 RepID=UPI0012DAD0E1|nr:hypothetical protein [Burkholderia diffusa]
MLPSDQPTTQAESPHPVSIQMLVVNAHGSGDQICAVDCVPTKSSWISIFARSMWADRLPHVILLEDGGATEGRGRDIAVPSFGQLSNPFVTLMVSV